jgi:putative DNA-invertase from lambdoid prophage Rac
MKLALYARVSKATEQTTDNQRVILNQYTNTHKEHEYFGLYTDEISSRKERPGKDEVLSLLRSGQVNGVVITALDRWGRSMKELVLDIDEFIQKGWAFISLRESIDLTTASGRFQASLFSAVAQFERDLISQRSKEGVERARRQGKVSGRHPPGCGCGKADHNGTTQPVYRTFNKGEVTEYSALVGWRDRFNVFTPVNDWRKRYSLKYRKDSDKGNLAAVH